MTAARIERVTLTVPELAAAEAFYRDALGFVRAGPPAPCPDRAALLGTGAALTVLPLRLGKEEVDLLAFDPPGAPYPAGSTSSDLWFQHCAIVVGDVAAARAQAARFGAVPITEGGPQHLPPNTGSVAAWKFRDPVGHPLELLWFPDGVGDPAWHAAGAPLHRGIDHTAVAVADAGRSTRFYEAVLGLRVTGRSANAGDAQGRLDAVARDRVDVVALSPAATPPHLELLGYRAGTRRPRPAREGPADTAVTRTVMAVPDVAEVARRLAGADAPSRRGTWDGRDALLARDPDGHALVVVAEPAAAG